MKALKKKYDRTVQLLMKIVTVNQKKRNGGLHEISLLITRP